MSDITSQDTQAHRARLLTFTPVSVLPHLGGTFVLFTAIAYFVSWQRTYTYYDQLGAPWFVRNFSPTRLLLESGVYLSVLIILGAIALGIVLGSRLSFKALANAAVLAGCVSMIAVIAAGVAERRVSPTTTFTMAQAAVVAGAMSAVLIVAALIARVRDREQAQLTSRVWVIIALLGVGLWRAPTLVGESTAERDGDPLQSQLGRVLPPNATADSGWRLVAALDRKFLVMKPAIRRDQRVFRMIESFDAWTITPAR